MFISAVSLIPPLLVGLLGGLVAALLGAAVQPAARALPKWLGLFGLTELRVVFGFVLGVSLAQAIALSTSRHHHTVTYLIWFMLAGISLIGVVALTTIIKRSAAIRAAAPELVSAEHRDTIQQIFQHRRAMVEMGFGAPWPDPTQRSIACAHYPAVVGKIDEWNRLIENRDRASSELRMKFFHELTLLSVSERYDTMVLAEGFARHTRQRALDGKLSEPIARGELWQVRGPVTHGPADGVHVRGYDEIAVSMEGVPDGDYTRVALACIARVQPVFDVAQGWSEATAIPVARDELAVFDKDTISREVKRIVTRERIAVVDGCPVCGEIG